MPRYFIDVAYRGTNYSGFQIQENAPTVQSEIEKAIALFQKEKVLLTGSSRTDAGVHALQNYFHFDLTGPVHPQFLYKANAILPNDIVIKGLWQMPDQAHCRFDALSRSYAYQITRVKDPFRQQTAFYYPYRLDLTLMEEAARIIRTQNNFLAFSKTNSQVKTHECTILRSEWSFQETLITYNIEANRFLRGMVRLLTGTLLKIGRAKISLDQLHEAFLAGSSASAYAAPAHGLILNNVNFPNSYFPAPLQSAKHSFPAVNS